MEKKGILCILLLVLALEIPGVNGWEINITSTATIIHDGDSFHIVGDEVRLADISAPEWNETGGQEAKSALTSLISGEILYIDTDQKGGRDPNERLVAVVYVEYNSTHYLNVNKRLLILDVVDLYDFTDNEFNPATWTEYVQYAFPPPPPTTYTLQVQPQDGSGATSPAPSTYSFNEGSTVPVSATPSPGWSFKHWLLDGSVSSTSASYIVAMNTNHVLKAVFTQDTTIPPEPTSTYYNLAISVEGSGTTIPSPESYTYNEDRVVTILATPESEWHFDHWILNGANIGADNPTTVTMNQNYQLKAVFEKNTIIIDNSEVSDPRCNISGQQTVKLHLSWTNGTSVTRGKIAVGEHNINGYNHWYTILEVGGDGWVSFNVESLTHEKKTWDVSEVNCTGITDFSMIIQPPAIIWDFVNVTLSILDDRVDVNSKPEVVWSASYAYDNKPFDGDVKLKIVTSQASTPTLVGEAYYYVESVTDEKYGLTAYKSNSVSIIYDRVKITEAGISSQVAGTGKVESVWVKAVYEFDNKEFAGEVNSDGVANKVFLNGFPMTWFSSEKVWRCEVASVEGGVLSYSVTGVVDVQHGLTAYYDAVGPQSIMWEKPFLETRLGVATILSVFAVVLVGLTLLVTLHGKTHSANSLIRKVSGVPSSVNAVDTPIYYGTTGGAIIRAIVIDGLHDFDEIKRRVGVSDDEFMKALYALIRVNAIGGSKKGMFDVDERIRGEWTRFYEK